MTPERWRDISRVYHAVLEREPRDRLSFLTEACAGDEELRRDVESLLASEQASCAFFDHPAWDDGSTVTLAPGTAFSTYRIESVLGEGGMGTVYRAIDARFNRPVAIKFLPSELADPAARRRFQREAQLASALNHPHILTVHDVGEFEGRAYLVTEFVDGGTLNDWARAESRTWRQVVDLLTGVADGLATAHGSGILHRDLKPANILVSKNGYAKLADFGLAKLAQGTPSDTTRTATDQCTRLGVVIGTIAYMSPEQAAGRPIDARSDIFSFGIVLYELLTGARPFAGPTDLETLQLIIRQPPAPLPNALPLGLRLLVEKTLEKDLADRYQSMRELVVDLRRLARDRVQEPAASKGAATARSRRHWVGLAAAAVIVASVGIVARWSSRAGSELDNPLANAQFTRLTDFPGSERDAAISPDGQFVIFLSDRDGPFDVWLSQVGSGRFTNLTHGNEFTGDLSSRAVGISSDGTQIWLAGRYPDQRLRVMPLVGGASQAFLAGNVVTVAWSADGARLAYHTGETGDPMFVSDRTGDSATQIYRNPTPGGHNHYPIWSRDGQWIYFVSGVFESREMDVWRIPASGGTAERLTRHNNDVTYPTPLNARTVLYLSPADDGSGPWMWALDVEQRTSRRVSYGLEKYLSLAASADGQRLVATVANPAASLWTVPISDHVVEERAVAPYPLPTVRAWAPRFGGATLFYLSSVGGGDGLWQYQDKRVLEILKGAERPLLEPVTTSATGDRVAVVLRGDGKVRLHVMNSDGTGLTPIAQSLDVRRSPGWSPDERWIVVGGNDANGAGLFKIPVPDGEPVRLVTGAAMSPVWSPQGGMIVYTGAVIAQYAPLLAVRPDGAPITLPEIQLRHGGERYRFLPSGKGLVYMQGDLPPQDFWLMDLATHARRPLTHLMSHGAMRTFDITPDGGQIVFDRLLDNADIVLIDRSHGVSLQ